MVKKNGIGIINQNVNTQPHEETSLAHHFLFISTCKGLNCDITAEETRKEKSMDYSLAFTIDGSTDITDQKIDLETISSKLQEEPCWTHLARPNQVVHFDCKSNNEKYFLLRSEPQIVIGFKISDRGTAKSNIVGQSTFQCNQSYIQEVSQFLHDIARDTRCNNVFASLKGAFIMI